MPELNSSQRDAVRYIDGPLLVLAGAGSGKTSVITHKIAWLIRDCGIAPQHITAVTFTNKAAREMKTRVADMLSARDARGLTISTFHTLGLNILRSNAHLLGYKGGFSIYDAEDALTLTRELLRATRGAGAEHAVSQISRWKNALLTPEQALAGHGGDPAGRQTALIYQEYQRNLRAYNAADFDDLIMQPVRLFHEHPAALDDWQNRIRYLLVDEYQDTNGCQYELVRLLAKPRGALTVVGDDDQSVYAWRGARPENLGQLQQDFPDLRLIKLEQNYRSTGRILKVANTLIGNNPHIFEKRLWSNLGYGEPVRVLRCRDEEHEAERVVSQLLHHKFVNRSDFRDYAILYRGNHQARLFERVLREQRVPYYLSGGTSFFERTEVRDIMSYLRLIANPDDDSAFLRVVNTPRREIGPTTLEKLGTYAAQRDIGLVDASFEIGLGEHLNDRQLAALRRFTHWLTGMADRARETDVKAIVRELLDAIRYDVWLQDTCDSPQTAEKRMDNVLDLLGWLQRLAGHEDGSPEFGELVARMTLAGMLDSDEDGRSDQVSLMTLHAAKGLEFPHVFIVGTEEGLLPHRSSLEQVADAGQPALPGVEEERRLAYVGITRARRTLTLTMAQRRKRYGEIVECEPSRFLAELPADDLQWEGEGHAADPAVKQERGASHLANLRELLG